MLNVIPRNKIVEKLMEEVQEFHSFLGQSPDQQTSFKPSLYGSERSTEQVFQERSSSRFFHPESRVAVQDLEIILKKNAEYDRNIWGQNSLLHQYVMTERVDNPAVDPRTLYHYCPEEDKLSPEGQMPDGWSKKMLFLQQEFANAPVVILFVTELAKAMDDYGTSSYQNLLIHSGSVAHYAWLQSLSMGYRGTVFAGTLPKSIRAFCSIYGYRKCQMFAYAFGK